MNRTCSMYLIQCPARPISPKVSLLERPVPGKASKSGTTGYIVIDAAVPWKSPAPEDATQAAPIADIDARRAGVVGPDFTRAAIVRAAVLPMTPEGIPVRGGAGVITVPLGLVRGREIWWGGAKAIPTAKTFASRALS